MREGGKLQIREKLPSELAEKIVPVMEVNPKLLRICNFVKSYAKSNTGSSIMYTGTADRDLYITSVALVGRNDAAFDGSGCAISATINGTTTVICEIKANTSPGALNNLESHRDFTVPIKIDRGTNITIALSFAAGTASYTGMICGFTDELINA